MPRHRPTYETWNSLRDAAFTVAEEILQADPPKGFLDSPTAHPKLIKDVTTELRLALSDTSVASRIEGGREPARFDPAEAEHFAFKIDLQRSIVFIKGYPDWDFHCMISEPDLRGFLRKIRSSRSGTKVAENAEKQCRDWFQSEVAKPKHRSRAEYKREAVARFEISVRAFDRIWKEETSKPENRDWSKAGRPTIKTP